MNGVLGEVERCMSISRAHEVFSEGIQANLHVDVHNIIRSAMNLATAKTHGRNVPATTFIIYRAKLNYTNKRSLGRVELSSNPT